MRREIADLDMVRVEDSAMFGRLCTVLPDEKGKELSCRSA
jgi:hypothetical protein